MEEEDALLAVKIANESQNRLVKKDGGCSKEQKNGIERFVRKDKRSIAHRASSSPSQQAAVSSTSSSSSPRQIINLITEEVIIGNDSTTLEHMNRDDNRAFNSSVRLSSAAGIAANSLNKRTKVSATSLASSCAPKNGISSFFLKRPISTVYNSSGFHDLISGDEPSRHKSRLFDSEIEILD